jgi:putative sigma-54 modulation protein
MVDRLDRQVVRHKGRIQEHQHEAIKHQDVTPLGEQAQ